MRRSLKKIADFWGGGIVESNPDEKIPWRAYVRNENHIRKKYVAFPTILG